MSNHVFIGLSLDGYIADRRGGLDFLHGVPNPDGLDFGYHAFLDRVDAVLMGRVTFETVLGFGIEWPYAKPVFVLSSTLESAPAELVDRVTVVSGELGEVVARLNALGHERLYIDGGRLIQGFLAEDRVDELILTRVPVLLGGGAPLFGDLPAHLELEHAGTEVLLGQLVQSTYRRKGEADAP